MKVKSESEVAQSCLTVHDPMDCSLPGSPVHGIFQARVLEWGAIAFSDILSLAGDNILRWWIEPFRGVTLFSWIWPMYTGGIHVINFVFLQLIFYYTGSVRQESKKEEGKLLFLSYLFLDCWYFLDRHLPSDCI